MDIKDTPMPNCPHCATVAQEHEAGRCMDAWVAEAVMGLKPEFFDEPWGGIGKPSGRRGWYIPPVHPVEYYSTDIADAWEVVEKASNGRLWNLSNGRGMVEGMGGSGYRFILNWASNEAVTGWGSTPMLAVCRAALEACDAE